MKNFVLILMLTLLFSSCKRDEQLAEGEGKLYTEIHRPQFHFSPEKMWMNDPNGMVYHNNEYHLFYQYNPNDVVWGPMHWGHAVSTDLVHWSHLPIALYPDSLGTIFSGSAVVDEQNSSGFGSADNPPLVAIYTYHDSEKEKQGSYDFQTQGLAYSIDNGRTWEKYENNPVIKNPGIRDFRDPKVFWHEATKKWVLILVAQDHAELYGSKDLKTWQKLSEFGKEYGAHGGVWECPDLFQLPVESEQTQKWVMIININPGAPNGGSGTQYFIGEFEGEKFVCDTDKSKTSWIDYGPDNYAGVTWANVPNNRKIFLGWMSNWAYAGLVPTHPWRSANTIPRDLTLVRINDSLYVKSSIVPELQKLTKAKKVFSSTVVTDSLDLTPNLGFPVTKAILEGSVEAKDFVVTFSNTIGQKISVGYESSENRYFIDRSAAGKNDFSENFGNVIYAPRVDSGNTVKFTMIIDVSSIEIFLDGGVSVMTSLFFPELEFSLLKIHSKSEAIGVHFLEVTELSAIW